MGRGKDALKKLLRTCGVDIRRYRPESSPTAQFVASLQTFEIDLLLDVGANRGQFAAETRSGGYRGDIVSFEPLSRAHSVLQRASRGDPRWRVHPRCALGDRVGEVEINIAANSDSSSLLPMLDSHLAAAPHTAYVGRESVSLATLDQAAVGYLENRVNPFLKIDTQGFEWQVLQGAREILPRIRGAQVELSLIPLYEGDHLWRETVGLMESLGFTLWIVQPFFIDPRNGRTLQLDATFYRLA